jgi:hypothetical protein
MVIDRAVAANAGANKASLLANEALAAVKAFKRALGSELIYSAASDNGFPGLVDKVGATYKAGGTTVGGQTSAWIVYVGTNGARLVLGDNGRFDNPAWNEQGQGFDGTNFFPAFTSYIEAYPALKIGHAKSIVRIANIDSSVDEDGKPVGRLTDAKIIEALALMPAELRANPADVVILMNSRARFQLQASRTAVNPTGVPAPIPTDVNGYRIVETSSIVDTEAVVS